MTDKKKYLAMSVYFICPNHEKNYGRKDQFLSSHLDKGKQTLLQMTFRFCHMDKTINHLGIHSYCPKIPDLELHFYSQDILSQTSIRVPSLGVD